MERINLLKKDDLSVKNKDKLNFGYFKEKRYFKNCPMENVDIDYVAIPLGLTFPQYFELNDSKTILVSNDGIKREITEKNDRITRILNESKENLTAIDLQKKGIAIIALKKKNKSFYEVCTNERICISPIPFQKNSLEDWENKEEEERVLLYEKINAIIESPIVLNSQYIFEITEEEAKEIEKNNKNCLKDTIKIRFKKIKKEAYKKDIKALECMRLYIEKNNYFFIGLHKILSKKNF